MHDLADTEPYQTYAFRGTDIAELLHTVVISNLEYGYDPKRPTQQQVDYHIEKHTGQNHDLHGPSYRLELPHDEPLYNRSKSREGRLSCYIGDILSSSPFASIFASRRPSPNGRAFSDFIP